MTDGPDRDTDIDPIRKWDPEFTERAMGLIRPVMKRYFRSEVRGLDLLPPGPQLVVSNHSGGLFAMDLPVFAADFYQQYGYDRPVYTLALDVLFTGPLIGPLTRAGLVPAAHGNAAEALRSGGVVLVFPGGDYDVYRPTRSANTIDFHGRTGYVRTALETGVPIVPMVSIGGQEGQLFLVRGYDLAKRLGLKQRIGFGQIPVTLGLPFGLNILLPLNFPLPTKIVTQVLEPIDIAATFGKNPDVDEVDTHVRAVMQTALDRLARERRLPVIG